MKFQDISPVREHVPYINQSQRIVLSNYYGEGTRVYQAKKCTEAAFGCTGDCCDEKKAEITSKIETCGGKLESIYEGNGHCWLRITPYEKNDEILSIMLSRSQIQHENGESLLHPYPPHTMILVTIMLIIYSNF
ncbi:hypothetical protein [Paenibacillus aceti]|uniref:Uncharacterized protein n=1 Tax=Paenibacillus aceti TaxID=1820010 RepID=A0ABQ1W835_9BACL|nr:hypothetical protein [Paenibacillus aceti]GGG18143.1 hypothetical protein GCM10010913_45360 [Paenibacillus aceti]